MEWCDCKDETDCKIVIKNILEKGIFLGEFIKAILKINNIISEFENICEIISNMALLQKLREIPELTMKYIVSNQSLYI